MQSERPQPVLFRKLRSARFRIRQALLSQRFGFSPSTIYDDGFYSGVGCEQGRVAAAPVAKVLQERFSPRSAFDFGCGQGALIAELAELGIEAAGCDGSSAGVARCSPSNFVFQADLKKPVVLNRTFDLVTCVEVAEHLPRRAAATLVESIVRAASQHIMFSASGPDQPGDDHINLRLPAYWADLFAQHGFEYRDADTREIREAFDRSGAPDWFQNSIVLEKPA